MPREEQKSHDSRLLDGAGRHALLSGGKPGVTARLDLPVIARHETEQWEIFIIHIRETFESFTSGFHREEKND